MERDLKWLWENQKEGARSKFEEVCYDVYLKEFPDAHVHKVEVTQGDGGVDIFIEELDGLFTIIQCKYFLGRLDDGRKKNIRESFKRAVEKNEMDNWILCVPMDFSHGEHNWWRTWRNSQKDKGVTIKLYDESKLKSLLKKHDLFDEYLNTVRIDEDFVDGIVNKDEKKKIHDRLYYLISAIETGDYDTFDIVFAVDQLGDLKAHRFFRGSHLLDYLDALSTLYAYHAEGNNLFGKILRDEDKIQQETSLRKKIVEEYKKLDF
ncbi:restriction endonuclease [Bacillus thuringiensis]